MSTSISDIEKGIKMLQTFLKTLGANIAVDEHCENLEPAIIHSLEIHNNVLKCGQLDQNTIEIVDSALNMPNGETITGFKGHKLSSKTMQKAIPFIMLQLYSNPCLFWLHIPAFYILARGQANDSGMN